ncbi:MAG: isoprenylcysteine carboxylmethyltransferase family protein [Dongiaceae bacterium]
MVQRLIKQSAVWFACMAVLLFVPAGTLNWPAGWLYLVEFALASFAMTRWMLRHNPELLAERMRPLIQRDQKTWDKALMTAFILLWCTWFVVMGLDAMRYGWSHVPVALQVLGALMVLVAMYIIFLTVRANTFAAPVVKIQKERGHHVVSDGPYAIVRHPMYAGALLLMAATPLMLGSWWGLATAPILIVLLGTRAVMEERTLMRELDGYTAYAARVRHRLVPMVW